MDAAARAHMDELRRVGAHMDELRGVASTRRAAARIGQPPGLPAAAWAPGVFWTAEDAAGQRCGCGHEAPTVLALCTHLERHNPRRVAAAAREPATAGACAVAVRPGVLCDCRECGDVHGGAGGGGSVLCSSCHHPRMLHFDSVRAKKAQNQPTE